jgi:hypothetical protein
LTIKKFLDIISPIKKFLYNQIKILEVLKMYSEHIARAFIEAAAVILIGVAIYKQDAINQFEEELKNKIKVRLSK